MERGMPLKLMHLRPTSRMSSAATTGSWLLDEGGDEGEDEDEDEGEEARAWRMGRPSGALRAKSAAAWKLVSEGWGWRWGETCVSVSILRARSRDAG